MTRIRRPWHLLPLESRAPWEFASGWLLRDFIAKDFDGNDSPVMIIPGFGANDDTVASLHRFLRRCGYRTYGWTLGRNLGSTAGMAERLRARAAELAARHERPIAVVGWSLGGVFARELARHLPGSIDHVITLGSPLAGGDATTIAPLFALANPNAKPISEEARQRRHIAPAVRCTAIYSRSDGIVPYQCASELAAPNTENIVIRGSHFGLIGNPMALFAVADRLQRNGPVRWPGWMKHAVPAQHRTIRS